MSGRESVGGLWGGSSIRGTPARVVVKEAAPPPSARESIEAAKSGKSAEGPPKRYSPKINPATGKPYRPGQRLAAQARKAAAS